jgi:ferredoxin
MTTRLHIDWTRCDGHGSCVELLPAVLTPDPFGFPDSVSGDRDPVVARRDSAAARHAVRSCPVMALQLFTTSDRRSR